MFLVLRQGIEPKRKRTRSKHRKQQARTLKAGWALGDAPLGQTKRPRLREGKGHAQVPLLSSRRTEA